MNMRIGYINLKISAVNHFYFRLSFHYRVIKKTIISLQNIEKMRKQRFYDINKRI